MYEHDTLVQKILNKKEALVLFFEQHERPQDLPLYSSVDIRDAGFKIAVVDTNLFPAGFNNLCSLALEDAALTFQDVVKARVPMCEHILIIAEEHTRNAWYLESVYALKTIIEKAEFKVEIASFLASEKACEDEGYLELTTAKGHLLKMYCLKQLLKKVETEGCPFDMIILNNDLTTGVPDILKQTNVPIYPSIKAGWYARLKSHHFKEANKMVEAFCRIVDIDPWLLSCLYLQVTDVSINEEADRQRLYESASVLFETIKQKYDDYGIKEKPFIFIKADAGTYGMGVVAIEHPEDILHLNRKARNKLSTGKSSQKILSYILQEGVPTISSVDNQVSEACIYQVANHFVGGFYRLNQQKSTRDNLNSQGMSFKKMCLDNKGCVYEDCGVDPDPNLEVYKLLGRLACLAAHREIIELEKNGKA